MSKKRIKRIRREIADDIYDLVMYEQRTIEWGDVEGLIYTAVTDKLLDIGIALFGKRIIDDGAFTDYCHKVSYDLCNWIKNNKE